MIVCMQFQHREAIFPGTGKAPFLIQGSHLSQRGENIFPNAGKIPFPIQERQAFQYGIPFSRNVEEAAREYQ